jgi:integrase
VALTNILIQKAKPREKRYILKDERGLHLEVQPSGGKWWRLRYWIGGKEGRLSLGTYPEVSLADARERREEARRLIAKGIDPSAARKAEKAAAEEAEATFENVAREWIGKNEPTWAPRHTESIVARLARHVFPFIGKRPIAEVNAPELLRVVKRIEAQGLNESAKRALQVCGQVFRYAVATCRAERDPSGDLRGALAPVKPKSFAAITDPKQVGGLLRAIDEFMGSFVVKAALTLAPLVFVRPGELRHAEWAEIDLDAAQWNIPAEKMKMGRPHIVPLARQAVAVLKELHALTGEGRYLFPSMRTNARPMSENTVNAALRRMGFGKDEMTGHGFRAMASTILHEQGWPSDVIERQLAHVERNKVKGAYNRAEYLPERTRVMQAWADYLDALKAGGAVIPMRGRKATGGA